MAWKGASETPLFKTPVKVFPEGKGIIGPMAQVMFHDFNQLGIKLRRVS